MPYPNITNLELSLLAEGDLEDIAQYTHKKHGEEHIDIYFSALAHGMSLIAENPDMGHVRDDIPEPYKAIQIEHHIIIYLKKEETVYIARILHENMELSQHRIDT